MVGRPPPIELVSWQLTIGMERPVSDRRLRVAIWHNLPSGGGQRAMHDQVVGLLGAGIEVKVWSPPSAQSLLGGLGVEETVVSIDPRKASRLSVRERWRLERRDLQAMEIHCEECLDQIEAWPADVVLAHPCQWYRVPPIARLGRLPSVAYIQEPFRPLYEADEGGGWPAPQASGPPFFRARKLIGDDLYTTSRRIQVRCEVDNARAFDRLLVNSLYSRESLLRAYGLESYVCRLGVDQRKFRPAPARDTSETFVISVGFLAPAKRPDFIIDAVAQLPRPRPRLVWVANGERVGYRDELVARANNAGVDLRIHMSASDEELVALLQQAACFVYAPRLEPLGLAPLEAAACGTPSVAVAEGGVRETVQDGVTGILCGPDPRDFAAAVRELVSNQSLRAKLGNGAIAAVSENWNSESATQALLHQLYIAVGHGDGPE